MPDWKRLVLQLRGKIRRLAQANLTTRDVDALVATRRGECNRCGECCKILFRCPFLIGRSAGQYACLIYPLRATQCRHYPLYPEDVLEIAGSCSFVFGNHAPIPTLIGERPGTAPCIAPAISMATPPEAFDTTNPP